ncbi:MAG: LuxR C-terminal-related transcriptional regulator [Rhodoglobus sp.]
MSEVTRVAVVDDHELVAIAVQNLIDSTEGLVFARHAATVAELVRPMRDAELVLLDLSLRDGSVPEENVQRIRNWGAEVLVLTSGEDPYLVRAASRTEVLGILRKSTPRDALMEALRAAARGELVPTTEWASALDTDPLLLATPLTARERQVLSLYASGLGARAVGARLFITENTVNDHLRRIRSLYHQLGRPAQTKVELYQRGIEDGYLQVPRRD